MEAPPSTSSFEVIVVGAGVMGSATAYFLSKVYGDKVLLLEQFDTLHKRGSSHGDSRITRRTYPQDHYTGLMSDAYKLWDEIETEANTKLFTKTGGLDFGMKTNPGLTSVLAAAQKHGVDHKVLSPEELKLRFPSLTLSPDSIAVYTPDSGMLNATKSVGTLQNLARSRGCVILDNTPVTNILSEVDLIRVITENREFTGKKLIVTAGAWTGKLVQSFERIELPLQPQQTTIAYWKVQQPEVYSATNFPVFIQYDEPMVYGTPCLEYPNMLKCGAHGGPACDPDTRDFVPAAQTVVSQFLASTFGGVETEPGHTESCMYTASPDGDFVIDALPSNPNILIGSGFSGHGFKLAPVVGRILSQLAVYGVHPYPECHQYFSLDRFKK